MLASGQQQQAGAGAVGGLLGGASSSSSSLLQPHMHGSCSFLMDDVDARSIGSSSSSMQALAATADPHLQGGGGVLGRLLGERELGGDEAFLSDGGGAGSEESRGWWVLGMAMTLGLGLGLKGGWGWR